jgi:RNA polymerase sigma-70 factor (ECF subfamily)
MADADQQQAAPCDEAAAPFESTTAAVSQLFREHNRVLVGYLTARLRSEQEAKEVAQEAYVRLLQLQEPGTPSLLRAYLFKTATNLAIDRLRHRSVRHRAEEQPELFAELTTTRGEMDDPAKQLLAREQADQLLGYLQELPITCQHVFNLHRLEGVPQHEVAVRLGFSERMVRLDLAPDSRVSTRFTLARREVRLERGQAFFAVAHNAVRPFIVHVNSLTVTAVGTAFDVRMGPSSTVVTVSEGRVNVAPGADEAGGGPSTNTESVRAGVGQRVTFYKSAHRLSVATLDPKVAGSWRDGTLQFVGEPLEDVVGAVNRYSAPPIVVAPAFQQARFTGTVSPTNVRDWLKALEQIYAVEVVDQGAHGILIRSRADDGAQK